jgi:hypothetical protein
MRGRGRAAALNTDRQMTMEPITQEEISIVATGFAQHALCLASPHACPSPTDLRMRGLFQSPLQAYYKHKQLGVRYLLI